MATYALKGLVALVGFLAGEVAEAVVLALRIVVVVVGVAEGCDGYARVSARVRPTYVEPSQAALSLSGSVCGGLGFQAMAPGGFENETWRRYSPRPPRRFIGIDMFARLRVQLTSGRCP